MLSPRSRRGSPLRPPAAKDDNGIAPIQFRLEAGRDQTVTADGQRLEGRGYTICDPRTGTPLGEDDFFFRIGGGIIADLVDADRHRAELQNRAFGPGRPLALVRQTVGTDWEAPAIDVYDSTRSVQAGRLPDDAADAVALYGSESYDAAFCLWEWRSPAGDRVGLRLLLAPGWTVEELPDR